MTGAEYRQKMVTETLSFHNIDKWIAKGFCGQGVRILELEDPDSEHGQYVKMVMEWAAPGSEVFLGRLSASSSGDELLHLALTLKDRTLEDEEAVAVLKTMDIIGASVSGSTSSAIDKMLKDTGAIIGCSAGNNSSEGVTGKYRNSGMSIGAIYMDGGVIKKEWYSASGDDELDFAMFHMDREGTSFSWPTFAGMCAIIKSRYPSFGQDNAYEVMKSISFDAGEIGFDTDFGWGVPVLPDDIESLEEVEEVEIVVPKEEPIQEPPIQEESVQEIPIQEGGGDMQLVKDMRISPNFMLSEFACKDGTVFVEFELIQNLQKLREFINMPIIINSGYRSPVYNAQIGGANESQHLYGKAVDIRKFNGISDEQFEKIAELMGFNGIGIYQTFYHIDIRDERARWRG